VEEKMAHHKILVEIVNLPASFLVDNRKKMYDFVTKVVDAIASAESLEVKPKDVNIIILQPLYYNFDAENKVVFARYSATSSAVLDVGWRTTAHMKVREVSSEVFGSEVVIKKAE
jgi:hypothetical protein